MEDTEVVCATLGHKLQSYTRTTFRLPPGSAVFEDVTYAFSATGGGSGESSVLMDVVVFADDKRIEGVVKPIAKAVAAFNAARESGHGAALVQGDQDVFRVTIGKLKPGQIVSCVRLRGVGVSRTAVMLCRDMRACRPHRVSTSPLAP
jgi:hypothetical protein